jgi:hypothetical protein
MNPEEIKPPGPSQRLVSWTPILDASWRLGLFVSILCYSVGLVISNFSAQRFGRYNLGLDKAEYIIVGFAWTVLTSIGFVMFLQLRRTYTNASTAPFTVKRKARCALLLLLVLCVLFYIFTSLTVVFDWSHKFFTMKAFNMFLAVLLMGFAIDFFARGVRKMVRDKGLSWRTFSELQMLMGVAVHGAYLPLALILYIETVFPVIPAAFGGGALESAEIFIKPEGQQLFRGMKVNVDPNGSIGKWGIVVELPDAVVITDKPTPPQADAKTIWVRKDRIEALLYLANKDK